MVNLDNLTAVLQAKIDALTGTAEYKEVLLLTKALEAVAGKGSVSDVLRAGAEQTVAIGLCGAEHLDAIDAAAAGKVAEIRSLDALPKTGGTMSGPLTLPNLVVTGGTPRQSFIETDAAADSKRFDLLVDGEKLLHRIVADSGNTAINWLEVRRNAVAAVWARYTAAVRAQIVTLADAAVITPDFVVGNVFSVTLSGNRALANPVNVPSDHQGGSILIQQDASGNRTLSFGSAWKFAGGNVPALSTAANAVDRLFYSVVSPTEIHAAIQRDFR